ncbi:ribokinase [Ignavigranum ruoffiae]
MANIGVVGSISMDYVVSADRPVKIGQTIYGQDFKMNFGGKGANQAVAAAKLGGRVTMIGAVGLDQIGQSLINNLESYGIDCSSVKKVANQGSGAAVISLIDGDNSIIYVPGANQALGANDILALKLVFSKFDMILVQNETPEATVSQLIHLASLIKVPIIYNPAPARKFALDLLSTVNYLTPNETEFVSIFETQNYEDVLSHYPNKILVTLGHQGVVYYDGHQLVQVPAYPVAEVVDTTGEGDTFNGALAVALSGGRNLHSAIQLANLAASLSIQKFGAQGGIPSLTELKASQHYSAID